MNEMHRPALAEMAAAVDRLNAALADSRYFLGAPANALADYSVRDRRLPDGAVVSWHFSLEAAGAELRRRNVEAEALATAMAAWRPPVDLAVLVPSAWLWFGGLGLGLALAFAVANGIAGWVR